jgi:hypothetical protein
MSIDPHGLARRRDNHVLNLSTDVLRSIPVRAALLIRHTIHDDARATRRQRRHSRTDDNRRGHADRHAHCHGIDVPAVVVVVMMVIVVMVVVVVMMVVAAAVVTVVIAAVVMIITAVMVVVTAVVVIASSAVMIAAAAAVIVANVMAAARMRSRRRAPARASAAQSLSAAMNTLPAVVETATRGRVDTRTRAAAETECLNIDGCRQQDTSDTDGRQPSNARHHSFSS